MMIFMELKFVRVLVLLVIFSLQMIVSCFSEHLCTSVKGWSLFSKPMKLLQVNILILVNQKFSLVGIWSLV